MTEEIEAVEEEEAAGAVVTNMGVSIAQTNELASNVERQVTRRAIVLRTQM